MERFYSQAFRVNPPKIWPKEQRAIDSAALERILAKARDELMGDLAVTLRTCVQPDRASSDLL